MRMIENYKAKVDGNDADSENEMTPEDQKSALITRGLGGKKNISDVDCCATRLRCTVVKPELVNEDVLRMTSPSGIVRKGQGIQVIYGPAVSVIKSNLEDYLEKAPNEEINTDETASESADAASVPYSHPASPALPHPIRYPTGHSGS